MDVFFKRLGQCGNCTQKALSLQRLRQKSGRCYISRNSSSSSSTKSLNKVNEEFADKGILTIDLEKEYDRTLKTIINDNYEVLTKVLSKDGGNKNNSSQRKDDRMFNMIKSINQREMKIENLVKTAATRLNQSYSHRRTERLKIPRYKCGIKVYNRFLKQLYGTIMSSDYGTTTRGLFEAYQSIPFPAPTYIMPEHLEDLLSLLMSSKWEEKLLKTRHESQADTIFLNILADLHASGMPVAVHEYNAAMNMTAKMNNNNLDDNLMPLVEDRFNQLKSSNNGLLTDVSTLNLLLSIASKTKNRKQNMDNVLQEFTTHDLKPDRFTLLILMRDRGRDCDVEGVREIFNQFETQGFVIDINTINTVIYSFIVAGDLKTAEALYYGLLDSGVKISDPNYSDDAADHQFSEPRMAQKLRLIDYLISLIRENNILTENDGNVDNNGKKNVFNYQLPTIPNRTTFTSFFNHYCLFGNYEKAINVLETMKNRDCPPTRHQYYKLVHAFVVHSSKLPQIWTLERYKDVLKSIDKKDYTYNLAKDAVLAYKRLDPSADVSNYLEDIKQRKGPMGLLVHRILHNLSK